MHIKLPLPRIHNTELLLILLIPIVVGLGFIALTTWEVKQRLHQERALAVTSGVVSSLKVSPHFGDRSKAAHVAFTDHRGESHTFVSKVRSSPPRYAIGEHVTVRYDPASKAHDLDATIDSFNEGWLGAVITGIIGTGFLTAGIGLLIVGWPQVVKRPRKRRRA